MQLVDPMPPAVVKSQFEWVTYNEPEGHLDNLAARLEKLPGIGPAARIVGFTYKDDTTLSRFNRRGYSNTYRLDMKADLKLQDACAGLESIQAMLTRALASELAARHGRADLLLVRHVLEHAHDPAAFVAALRELVKPGGHMLFEMPDSAKFIAACDYSFIWEEHITYFSEETFAAFISGAGLELRETITYPYPLEDSLIGIVQNGEKTAIDGSERVSPESLVAGGQVFAQRFSELQSRMQSLFRAWRDSGKRIAIFGAGHLATKFINLFALTDFIECVIDDNPHKQAVLMPGSRLPIRGSGALTDIDVCLLSLNPESEQKVLAKNQPFLDRGGQFLSIFALSPKTVYSASAA